MKRARARRNAEERITGVIRWWRPFGGRLQVERTKDTTEEHTKAARKLRRKKGKKKN